MSENAAGGYWWQAGEVDRPPRWRGENHISYHSIEHRQPLQREQAYGFAIRQAGMTLHPRPETPALQTVGAE